MNPPARPRRFARIVVRLLLGLTLVVVVLFAALLYVLAHLDAKPIKDRVQKAAHDAGIDLDYGQTGLSLFSGFVLHDLKIASAPEDRPLAPTLAEVSEIRIGWSLGGLLGRTIEEAGIHGVTVTVLQDEKGETSVDRFLAHRAKVSPPGPPPPPSPATPVSKLLTSLIPPNTVALNKLSLDGITARLIRTREGRAVEQVRAGTLGLAGRLKGGAGKLELLVDIGTAEKPLPVEVVQEELDATGSVVAGSAKPLTASPWIQLKGDERGLTLAFAASIDRRELVPSLPTGSVAKGRVRVTFEPASSNTAVSVEEFDLLEKGVTATASVDLHDDANGSAQPMVRSAKVAADLDLVVARLQDLIPPGITLKKGALNITAAEVGLAGPNQASLLPGAPILIAPGGSLDVQLSLDSLGMDKQGSKTSIATTRLNVHGQPGQIDVTGSVDRVVLGEPARPDTDVEGITLKATARPESDGRIALTASVPVKRAQVHGSSQIDARGVELGVDGTLRELSRFDGKLTAGLQSVRYIAKGQDVAANRISTALKLDGAVYNAAAPAASSAELVLESSMADATVRMARKLIRASGLKLALDASVKEGSVMRSSLQLPLERLSLDSGPEDPHLAPTSMQIDLQTGPIALDRERSARSRAHVTAGFSLGAMKLKADIEKETDSVTFDISGGADKLGALAGLARGSASAEDRKMLEQMGLDLQTKGTADRLSNTSALSVNHKTRIVLNRPSVHREDLDFAARAVTLLLDSHGTTQKHAFDLNVNLDSPRINSTGGSGQQKVQLRGSFDMGHPHVDLHIAGSGVTGPEGSFDLTGGYDPATNVVDWSMDGELSRLGLVGVVMPPSLARKHKVDWETITLSAHGKGKHPSLVTKYRPGAPPRFELAEDALAAARGTVKLDLTAGGVDYKGEDDTALALPSLGLHINSNIQAAKAHADVSIDIPSVQARGSGHKFSAEKLAPSFVLDSVGDKSNGEAKLSVNFTAASIDQDAEPAYRIGNMELKVKASADTSGSVRIERVLFDNKAGGTRLELHGGMDFRPLGSETSTPDQIILRALSSNTIPGRKNLLIQGSLKQQLDVLNTAPERFKGSGTVTVPFRVESGDMTFVHLRTALRFKDVSVNLPRSGYSVANLNGHVPMDQDLRLDENWKVTQLTGASSSAYTRARFSDQQAFVQETPFIQAAQILADVSDDPQHPDVMELKNFVANIAIDRNLISLDQIESDLAGGHMSGQLIVDYQGTDTELIFHGGVTGLHVQQDPERLDANAAIRLRPWKRLLDGRIEVVHLGKVHLRKMLDWYDPYMSDTKANRARKGLEYGYPKQVRIRFHEGIAGFAMDLGGLAAAVRIDELNSPVGPILERYLARRLRKKEDDQ